MNTLGFRVLLTYALYTVFTPLWTLVALRMRAHLYVHMTVAIVFLSALFAHAAMYWTLIVNFCE